MFRELPGDGVKHEIDVYIRESVENFAAEGIVPKLAVIRAGDDDGQKYYEGAILRQSDEYGIETQAINFTSNIGQALVDYVKAGAKKRGCYEVTLNVWTGNDGAKAFYDKMGMKTMSAKMEMIL